MPKQMRRLGGPWEELTEPRHMHPKACVRVQISSFCLDMSCHSFSRWSAGLLDCEVYVDCCLGGVVRSPEDSSKNQRSTAKQIIRQATFFYFFIFFFRRMGKQSNNISNLACHYFYGTRRMRQLALGCESN